MKLLELWIVRPIIEPLLCRDPPSLFRVDPATSLGGITCCASDNHFFLFGASSATFNHTILQLSASIGSYSIVFTMAPEKDSSNVVQRLRNSEAPLPRGKLPDELQKMVDDEETLLDQIYDGT